MKSEYLLPFPDLTKPLSGCKQPRRTKAVKALLHAFLTNKFEDKVPCSPEGDKLLTKGFGSNTLLHIATFYGASDPVDSLLAAGFDTSIRNIRSQTALDSAIANKLILGHCKSSLFIESGTLSGQDVSERPRLRKSYGPHPSHLVTEFQ